MRYQPSEFRWLDAPVNHRVDLRTFREAYRAGSLTRAAARTSGFVRAYLAAVFASRS